MFRLKQKSRQSDQALSVFEQAMRQSVWMIVLERALRLGVALATLALFFLAVSWLGLWRHVSFAWRLAGVSATGLLLLLLLVRELMRGWPSQNAAQKRIDALAPPGLLPAQSLQDTLTQTDAEQITQGLWTLHRQRLEAILSELPLLSLRTDLARFDPYALRAFAVVCAIGAAFVAGDEKWSRLAMAFDWHRSFLFASPQHIDAWFEPPAYTGRPALMLITQGGAISVPINAVLRTLPENSPVSVEGAFVMIAEQDRQPDHASASSNRQSVFKITGVGRLALPDGRIFAVTTIPDNAPTIAFSEPVQNNASGSMTILYKAQDDYGVKSVEAAFSQAAHMEQALYEPPRLALDVSSGASDEIEMRATIDLAESPYAGVTTMMRLIAKDAADNIGVSQSMSVTLPQRLFKNSIAQIIIEQRRRLALNRDMRASVAMVLDDLLSSSQAIELSSSVYLGLRAARLGLDGNRRDDELRNTVDLLWAVALQAEEDKAPQAQKDMRAADRALRQSLRQDESDEVLAQQVANLRESLANLLKQLTARADQETQSQDDVEAENVSAEDLSQILDEIEAAARSKDRALAEQLLNELQDVMENLNANGDKDKKTSDQQASKQSLKELDALARAQQQLLDETHRASRDPDMRNNGEADQNATAQMEADALHQQQNDLRQRLERQQEALREKDFDASGALDAAREAMKEAEEALGGKGEGAAAQAAQTRALNALRQSADRLAEKIQTAQEGSGHRPGSGRRRAIGGNGRDPLGRAIGGKDLLHDKNDPLGMAPIQRARQLQEELRRRLSQPERPAQEHDYLQRLLRP